MLERAESGHKRPGGANRRASRVPVARKTIKAKCYNVAVILSAGQAEFSQRDAFHCRDNLPGVQFVPALRCRHAANRDGTSADTDHLGHAPHSADPEVGGILGEKMRD